MKKLNELSDVSEVAPKKNDKRAENKG